jgi:NADH dehydrogenase
MKILVTGGTGFIGPKVVHELRAHGHAVRVLVRREQKVLDAEVVVGDVTDAASLRAAVEGCTHVVHLVAILRGKPEDFERIMTQGTQNLVAAAKGAGVERFVHMSALGTGDAKLAGVPYFKAKAAMEAAVIGSGIPYTIFRPGFVFGRGAGALSTFMGQVRSLPVVPIIGPGTERFQPIWVDDVAEYFTRAVELPEAANRIFEIGVPDPVSWNELYAAIARVVGKQRRFVHIPFGVARAGATATQWLPGAPLSADQVTMLQADYLVSNSDAADTFKLELVPLEEQLRRAAAA